MQFPIIWVIKKPSIIAPNRQIAFVSPFAIKDELRPSSENLLGAS